MDSAWAKLHDGETYKVYREPGFSMFRYTVVSPKGTVLTSACTRWGARWAIRRAMRRRVAPWWEQPVVEEIRPGGDAR